MKVSVFGLGYVGSVSAASFAADGHTVVGVDVNPDKVASLNEGRSPIVEKGLEELIADRRGRRLAAGDDRHRRGDCRDRAVAALRRHAEPQERQPRLVVPRAGVRADRRGAQEQRRRTTWSWSAAPCCQARPTTSSSRRWSRRPARVYGDRLRRHGQSGVPARRHRDPRLPQSAADPGRPQLRRRMRPRPRRSTPASTRRWWRPASGPRR